MTVSPELQKNEDAVDRARKTLALITYGAITLGVGLMLFPGLAVVGGTLVAGGLLDIAVDKSIGEEVSKKWKEFKVKIGNIFTFKGSNTPQSGSQPINA